MSFKLDKSQTEVTVWVILTFVAIQFMPYFYAYDIYGKESFNALPVYFKIFLCHGSSLLLCFLITLYLASFSFMDMLEMLGLKKGIVPGFTLSLLAALPFLLGMLYLHGFNKHVSFIDIWVNGIHPGYYEEILYRGFLAGILVRYAKWPVLIPIVFSSLFFAAGHLYQAHNISQSVLIFCTAMGVGTGFFLLYKYCIWNLWFPLFLHSFMDTAAVITNWHGNIIMGLKDNIFRGATILIAIYISYRITKREIMKRKSKPKKFVAKLEY